MKGLLNLLISSSKVFFFFGSNFRGTLKPLDCSSGSAIVFPKSDFGNGTGLLELGKKWSAPVSRHATFGPAIGCIGFAGLLPAVICGVLHLVLSALSADYGENYVISLAYSRDPTNN